MSSSDWSKIISASVVPVVIISACGLLCLAFYNRLAAIVSRLRTFQRERLHEQKAMATEADSAQRRRLLENLEAQTAHVLRRAKLIRLTLFFLLLTIALLIACSIMLALSAVAESAVLIAVPLFVLGLLTMLAATISALIELKAALAPAELESRLVSELLNDEQSDSI